MSLMPVELQDRFKLEKQRVFLNGTQALVRLCLLQSEFDRRAGLNTAGYVTGYRGSPVGGLDQQFPRAAKELTAANVVFEPALNEDLAATAIWGAQQAEMRGEGSYDGVFCLWYGKGPGVDRSGDALRHGNLAGSSKHGGVMVLMGDDHTCESSTTAHQSEFALMDAMIPVLNPANVSEIIEYGLHGLALSRFSGVWCGLKCVKDNVESTASIDSAPEDYQCRVPRDYAVPEGGLNIRTNDHPVQQEARLHQHKLKAVHAYARENLLDKVIFSDAASGQSADGQPPARIGIVSTGKSYMDSVQALEELGIGENNAASYGVSLYKVAMPWPLEPHGIAEFCAGLDLVIVVEEKRSLIEWQLKDVLHDKPGVTRVIGKKDENGESLFQSEGALNPVQIAAAIATRIAALRNDKAMQLAAEQLLKRLNQERTALAVQRLPYFCAGCPHNSSTVIPEGSRAYAGIGCHWMVQLMDRGTEGYTQMGGEGANWIGESHFSTRKHIIQNIGDGTFNHSGVMAIRAAIASNANMTFKVLYNDAVAMTGGQGNDGGLTVYDIIRLVHAAGVKKTVVVSDKPQELDKSRLPGTIRTDHRDNLMQVQKQLAGIDGVTVLVYEQTCASEKRRRRKRGLMPEAPAKVFINDAVCEGCGDCGVQSNCVAIVPLDTEFGRKRKIDQSSCNQDLSCINGFCPSFVTVQGGQLKKPQRVTTTMPEVAEPVVKVGLEKPYAIALTGVGGTGVVTVGALLGMAAHLEGRGCGIIDMAGLAQKGGAVVSHIKIASTPEDISAIRIAPGGTDLLLGCDLLVSTGEAVLRILNERICQAVINTHQKMPGDFTQNPDLEMPANLMQQRMLKSLGDDAISFVDATHIANTLMGDSIAANLFVLGVAYQRGLVPLGIDAINKAIELNAVQVEFNQQALQWGRLWQSNRSFVEEAVRDNSVQATAGKSHDETVDELIDKRVAYLTDYQDANYALSFRQLVNRVKAVDTGSGQALTEAVVRSLYKLRACKDEYEVARLYNTPEFREKLAQQFAGDYTLKVQLAPPLLSRVNPASGKAKKREFGPWVFTLFKHLAGFKRLRGTWLDVFGWTAERRMERNLVVQYEKIVNELIDQLERDAGKINYDVACQLAGLPMDIRGFGHVKMRSVEMFEKRLHELQGKLLDDRERQQSEVA